MAHNYDSYSMQRDKAHIGVSLFVGDGRISPTWDRKIKIVQ